MRSGLEGGKLFANEESFGKNGSLLSNFSSFQAASANKDPNKLKNFEIFCYDFMLDIKGHLWIIEINQDQTRTDRKALLVNVTYFTSDVHKSLEYR